LGAIECNFTINIEPEIDALISDISLRKNIILIAKEAINNAAKYSKAQNINISMQHISNQIILKIVDDGIGFDTNLIVGNGLQNMKKRAEEVHGNFEIISNKNKGSSICLRFFVPKL
jgi:signal transduction histidine kinase